MPIELFRKPWMWAREAAGVPDGIPHDFRCTARASVPRSSVMAVGDTTESICRCYAITDETVLRERQQARRASPLCTDGAEHGHRTVGNALVDAVRERSLAALSRRKLIGRHRA